MVSTLKHGHLIKMTRIENENEIALYQIHPYFWNDKERILFALNRKKQTSGTKRLGFLTASGPKNRPMFAYMYRKKNVLSVEAKSLKVPQVPWETQEGKQS